MATSTTPFNNYWDDTTTLRTNGAAMRAALESIGLVRTADTGQIDWTTATVVNGQTSRGYEVWRFNDALQATKPVFFRLDWYTWSSASQAYSVGIRFWVGQGSDGAGNITGETGQSTIVIGDWNGPKASQWDSTSRDLWVSGDAGRVNCFWGADQRTISDSSAGGFSLMRTVNADGTPNGDGLLAGWWYSSAVSVANNTVYTYLFGSTAPAGSWAESKLSTSNQGQYSLTSFSIRNSTGLYGSDVYVQPFIPNSFRGIEHPPVDWLFYHWSVIMPGDTFSVSHMGATRTYKGTHVAPYVSGPSGGDRDTSWRVAIRWE